MGLDVQKLVKLVEARTPLYDHKAHCEKREIEGLWDEVAVEMGATPAECKMKWYVLRGTYCRILRETQNGANKRKRWYLSEAMAFLYDTIVERKNSIRKSNDVKLEAMNYVGEEGDVAYSMKQPSPSDRMAEGPSFSASKQGGFDHDHSSLTAAPLVKEDTELAFFKSIMPDVKKLSARRRREFKELVLCNLNRFLDEEEDNGETL